MKYEVNRLTGYHLFFRSIVWGFILFIFSYLTVYLLQIYFSKITIVAEFLILSLTLVFSFILPKGLNHFFFDKASEAKKSS